MPGVSGFDEAAVVRKAAACSDSAFEALMGEQQPFLRITIAKYAENREDREDLQAEIIARLLDAGKKPLKAWRPIAPFAAYLCTIAARHCIRWSRRQSALRARELPQLGPPSAGRDPSGVIAELVAAPAACQPDVRVMHGELQRWVVEGLDGLRPRDRLVLKLRFMEGLNGPSIGRALGISDNAAKLAIFKALRRLERVLDETEPAMWEVALS